MLYDILDWICEKVLVFIVLIPCVVVIFLCGVLFREVTGDNEQVYISREAPKLTQISNSTKFQGRKCAYYIDETTKIIYLVVGNNGTYACAVSTVLNDDGKPMNLEEFKGLGG